jgi:hypothetical protein
LDLEDGVGFRDGAGLVGFVDAHKSPLLYSLARRYCTR